MTSHLPAVLFLIPLLTGISMPILAFSRPAWCRPMLLLAVCAMTVTAAANLVVVMNGGDIRYSFSGWMPPLGIEWLADRLASVMMLALSVLAALCVLYESMLSRMAGSHGAAGGGTLLRCILILLLLSGLTGVVFAADLFNVFVFVEVAALSAAALIAMAGGKALVFGFRYLILASIGATFYLLGVGFFYAATGTLNMADVAQRLTGLLESRAVIVGLVFMFIGLAIKMALMPLHGWLPDAYTYAPDEVSPLLSSLVTKVALFAWVRIMYWVLNYGQGHETAEVLRVCWAFGALAAVGGAFLALIQQDLKRMFAYGGVSHIGLIMIGAGLGNQTGLAGSMFYLINDAVMQATLFMLAGIAISHFGIRTLEELRELRTRAPWMIGAFIIVALSMIGIPPTGGFFGKWYIVLGALQSGAYLAVAAIVISTLLTLAYFMGLFVRVFAVAQVDRNVAPRKTPLALRLCIGALCGGIITLGIFSDRVVRILLDATNSLKL
jgi:multicomponent Na+:H+ antiporter subunit D